MVVLNTLMKKERMQKYIRKERNGKRKRGNKMSECSIIHNGFGVRKTISLIFEPIDDLLTDQEMNDDAKVIYSILSTYLPASTYFGLLKLIQGKPL